MKETALTQLDRRGQLILNVDTVILLKKYLDLLQWFSFSAQKLELFSILNDLQTVHTLWS